MLVYLQSERDLLDKLRLAYENEQAKGLSLMEVVQCRSIVVKAMGEDGTASMELIYYHVQEDSSRKVCTHTQILQIGLI